MVSVNEQLQLMLYLFKKTIFEKWLKGKMCLDSCIADDYNEVLENILILVRGEK